MKLMTKAIENKLAKHPLYSQDGKGENAEIIFKVFNPYGRGTWYVLEGEKRPNGDWMLYGIVDIMEREYGYFLLSDLQNYRNRFGLGFERDMYFNGKRVKDIS